MAPKQILNRLAAFSMILTPFALAVGLLAGCEAGTAGPDMLSKAEDALVIDRAWDEDIGGYRCSYALVSWENKLGRTFRAVTIQAIAYDSKGKKINENQRSFFAHERGSIGPGFKGTLKIPVEIGNSRFKKMTASVISLK